MLRSLTPNRIRQAGYAPLLALGMAIMFARLPILAKTLTLLDFASLSAGLVVSTFAATCCSFGFYTHLQRCLPVYLMRRQNRAASTQISQTMLAAIAGGSLGILLGLLGFSPGGILSTYLALGSLHGLILHLFLTVTLESRSGGNPMLYARQHLVRSVMTLGAGVFAAFAFGSAAAVLIGEILAGGIAILWVLAGMQRRLGVPAPTSFALGLRSIRAVDWVSMLTLLAYTLVASLTTQLDRLLSPALLTREQFAHYSFAWIIIIAALSVQSLVSASASPMIVRRLEVYGAARAFHFTLKISGGILLLAIAAALPCIYLADLAISRMYPQYSDVTAIIPIIALTAALRILDFWPSFLVAAGRERSTLIAAVTTVAGVMAAWHFAVGWHSATLAEMAYLGLAVAAASYALNLIIAWKKSRDS